MSYPQPPSGQQYPQYPQHPYPQQYPYPYQPYPYPPQYGYGWQRPNPSGQSIAGMVLGILGLVSTLLTFILPILLGLLGLILAATGRHRDRMIGAPTATSTAGMVCSSIVLALVLLALLFFATGVLDFDDYRVVL
ncbi:hypothetical protein ABZ639_21805 [Saccharomonospora sp. NPDC006951]